MSSKSVKQRRSKGVAVDPVAVRDARRAAGLSLAQIAQGSISRQAFHLIETGQSRPSIEVLRHIAHRTGRKVSDFYAPGTGPRPPEPTPSGLLELERLVERRDYRTAVDFGTRLLETMTEPASEGGVRLLLGESLVMERMPDAALDHLRLARARFDEIFDAWSSVEAMDWEAMALYLLDQPECLAMLRDALERCRRLDPVVDATYIRILTHLATVHISRHEGREAVRYYEEAAQLSDRVRDLAQVARSYDGLSQAYGRLGHNGQAIAFANKAIAMYSRQSDMAGVYRAENNLGDLLLQLGDLDSAERHFQKALEGFQEEEVDRRAKGYVLVNLAEIALRRGMLDDARSKVHEALELADRLGEAIVKANCELLLGRVAGQLKETEAAKTHYSGAIEILRGQKMPERLREAHLGYGRLLKQAGELALAADQFELAAEFASGNVESKTDGVYVRPMSG